MIQTKEEAIRDLKIALPYIRHSIIEAKKEGIAKLAIIREDPDGGGKLLCRFDAEIIDAICLALDMPEQTAEDNMKAAAHRLCSELGIT